VHWYDRARELAKSKNIKYKDMALILDITEGAISHYLNGRREPSILQYVTLARMLDVSMEYLYSGKNTLPDSYIMQFESLSVKNKEDIFAAIRVLSAATLEKKDS
jgi:transcriptional regulator with XRE-family HTH domain